MFRKHGAFRKKLIVEAKDTFDSRYFRRKEATAWSRRPQTYGSTRDRTHVSPCRSWFPLREPVLLPA